MPYIDAVHNRTQEDRILYLLQAAWPNWTPALALAQISLQYNARIFALRRKGWQIANRVEVVDGVKHGSFRLGSEPVARSAELRSRDQVRERCEIATKKASDGLLFEVERDRTYLE